MKYILVQYPDSTILREQEWFDECIPTTIRFGAEAYFVPENLFNILLIHEED